MINMRLICGMLIGLLLLSISGKAQELKINEKGEKIISYPDGSWKYFNALLNEDRALQLADTAFLDSKREKESKVYALRLLEEVKGVYYDLSEELAFQEEQLLANQDTMEQVKLGFLDLSTPQAKALEKRVFRQQLNRTLVMSKLEKAAELIGVCDQMVDMSRSEREAFYPKYYLLRQDLNKLLAEEIVLEEKVVEKEVLPDLRAQSSSKTQKAGCKIVFEGEDNITGQYRKTLEPEHLFSFTPDRLKDFFTEGELLDCSGFLSKITGGYYLILEFGVHAPNARSSYGGLGRGSQAIIKTMKGKQIILYCTTLDTGNYNSLKNVYTFRGQYRLSNSDVKQLKKSEVDYLRVFWQTGFEDYEFFNLDFFKQQIECLNAK